MEAQEGACALSYVALKDQLKRVHLYKPISASYRVARRLRYRLEIVRRDVRSAYQYRKYRNRLAPDGLPIPPPRLIQLVVQTTSIDRYLQGGKQGIDCIQATLSRNGIDLRAFETVLDFGCGCGRVLRYWREFECVRVNGTDYNPELVRWCQKNLDFVHCSRNNLAPPLDLANASFDFVYAFSVFTHLSEELQIAWMDELARVLKPRGFLLLTTHGEQFSKNLAPELKQQFLAGKMVIAGDNRTVGSNDYGAYHPTQYVVETLGRGFNLIDYVPNGALVCGSQDLFLFQKH